jgi:tight adherence protein C
MPEAIALGGSLAVALVWAGAFGLLDPGLLRRRGRLDRYVRSLRPDAGGGRTALSVIDLVIDALRWIGRPFLRLSRARGMAVAEDLLLDAGRPRQLTAVALVEVRAGCAVALAAAGAATTLFAGRPELVPIGILAGAIVGNAIPAVVLSRTASGRRVGMSRALPAALDMLALAADAGLGLDSAMIHVVRRWDNALTAEFKRFLVEVELGRERRVALRELGRRVRLPEIDRFTSALIQADLLGVPLARVLQEQASDVRARRRRRAEEQARTAPVKMLFPMVLLIFPALFIVILGPAVPRLMDALAIGP